MYFKIITEYKWILKAKKSESFLTEIKAGFFAHKNMFLQICRNVPSYMPGSN